jgi:hypothetical protein
MHVTMTDTCIYVHVSRVLLALADHVGHPAARKIKHREVFPALVLAELQAHAHICTPIEPLPTATLEDSGTPIALATLRQRWRNFPLSMLAPLKHATNTYKHKSSPAPRIHARASSSTASAHLDWFISNTNQSSTRGGKPAARTTPIVMKMGTGLPL